MNKILILCVSAMVFAAGVFAQENILTKPRAKNQLGAGNYFTYEFSKRPSIGTVIVKIKIFDKANKQISGYNIKGFSGMPSMGNAHDSGETAFKQNKKGDYLLPVNVVMLGEWEVLIKIEKEKKQIFSGRIRFNVK